METKLTLKLDQAVIESAKVYAKMNKRSLSKLVEDYFRSIMMERSAGPSRISPLVQELSGIITESDLADADYSGYLEKKYE